MIEAAVQPDLVSSMAQMIVEKPMTEPTDKSMPPSRMTMRHAGCDQAGDRDLAKDVGEIAVGQEDVPARGRMRRGERADQADDQQTPIELGARQCAKRFHAGVSHECVAMPGAARRITASCVALPRCEQTGLMSLAHHQHPIGEQEKFRHFRSDHDDAETLLGQFEDQFVDFLLGADVDAARRLVEQEDTRLVASHLPMTIFCWLPPESVATTWSMPAHRTESRLTTSSANASSRAKARNGEPRHRADRGQGDIVADRLCQMEAALLAVLGHERDAQAIGVGRRAGCRRRCRRWQSRRHASRARLRRWIPGFRCGRSRADRRCRGFRPAAAGS